MWEDYQNLSKMLYKRIDGYKLKFNTSNHKWNQNLSQICKFLDIKFFPEKIKKVKNIEKYCGDYFSNGNNITQYRSIIKIKAFDDNLYAEVKFWKNMRLIPIGVDKFQVQSFPIIFQFKNDTFQVLGNYGWDINEFIFTKIKEEQ